MAKFRKVYLIVEDNQIFGDVEMVNIYRDKDTSESVCASQQRKLIAESTHYSNTGKSVPKLKVHCFYMVHESFFG